MGVSLRDQLVKAGLVDKKELRRANQELKIERRTQQGQRESKHVVEVREREERQRRADEDIAHRKAVRAERQAQREAEARAHQADQLLSFHALRLFPGPQRFWHPTLDGRHLHRLDISEQMAGDLRAGRAGVGAVLRLGEVDYVVAPVVIVQRVLQILPERIMFWNKEPPDPNDPAERLL